MKNGTYDAFPWPVVVLCSAVGLCIYAIGWYLMAGLGHSWGVLYLLYCVWVEYRVLRMSCRHCVYFGKTCAFGRGKVCSWFFTPQTPEAFAERQISWRDMVPDFLVSLIPLGVGIILLVRRFNWGVILLMVVLFLLSSVGTGLIRGCLACRYCRQREIGCPAERLFRKSQKANP
jgi:hypothetical protein